MTMPRRLTGLENLTVDPKKGLRMKVRTEFAPYEDIDEEGNLSYVQKMPETIKRLRYTLLHLNELGLKEDYIAGLPQQNVALALPERFGRKAPSLEEYSPEYEAQIGPELKTAWASINAQPNTTANMSAYEAYGTVHGEWGDSNPFKSTQPVNITPWGVKVGAGERAVNPQTGQEYIGGQGVTGRSFGKTPYYGTQAEWASAGQPGAQTWEQYLAKNPPPVDTVVNIAGTNEIEFPDLPAGTYLAQLATGERIQIPPNMLDKFTGQRPSTQAVQIMPQGAIFLGEKEGRIYYLPAEYRQMAVTPQPEQAFVSQVPHNLPELDIEGMALKTQEAMRKASAEVRLARLWPASMSVEELRTKLATETETRSSFVSALQTVGPNENTVGLLVDLFPEITQEEVNEIFKAPPIPVDMAKAASPAFAIDALTQETNPVRGVVEQRKWYENRYKMLEVGNRAFFSAYQVPPELQETFEKPPAELMTDARQGEVGKMAGFLPPAMFDGGAVKLHPGLDVYQWVEVTAHESGHKLWDKLDKPQQDEFWETLNSHKEIRDLIMPTADYYADNGMLPTEVYATLLAKMPTLKDVDVRDFEKFYFGIPLGKLQRPVEQKTAPQQPAEPSPFDVTSAQVTAGEPEAERPFTPREFTIGPVKPGAEGADWRAKAMTSFDPFARMYQTLLKGEELIGAGGEAAMAGPAGPMKLGAKAIGKAWDAMGIPERTAIAKAAGLKGKVASKAAKMLTTDEINALKGGLVKAGEAAKAVPKAELKPTTPVPEAKPPAVEAPLVKEGVSGAVPPAKPPEVVQALNPPTPPESNILGNLQDTDELVNVMTKPDVFRRIANLPGIKQIQSYLNPAAVAKTAPEKAVIARAALREEGANKAIGAFSKLEAIGKRDVVWGKLDDTQRITGGKLTGKSLNEVLTYRGKYANDMTPQQKQWANTFHELEQAKLNLLKDNGIQINELAFEEGGEYVGRRVVGRVDNKTGELLESAFVGSPGPGRPGAKMGAEKTRVFKDINEAIDAGYRYLPPDEALFLNLKGAYNRIADKQVSEWVLDRVAWRTAGAPEALQTAALDARTKLWQSRQVEAALNRAVRGERVPDSTLNSIGKSYPDEAARLKKLIPEIQGPAPQTADEVQALTARAKSIQTEAQASYFKAVDARARAREAAIATHLDEARVSAPAFAGKILTGPEAKETAEILNRAFTASYGDLDKIVTAVNKVNSIGRYFALAGDASPLLIQLIGFPFRFPKVYGKSAANFVKALFSEASQAKYLAANNDIIQKSRNLILSKGGQTEFTEAFRSGGIMQSKYAKAPKAVLEPFQRGFEAAIDTAGIELRKAFEHMATTPERTAEIEQFINEIRGVTSSARIGVSPSVRAAETAAFLAPRYNRATFAVVSDMARGGIRGDQARKFLGSLIGGGVALGTAITLARGEGWKKVADHLDIENAREFMTWEVAGQRVGPGSKMRSLSVLLGKVIKDPDNTVKHATDFIRGNFSPAVSTTYDIIMGEDYVGEPTRPGKRLGGFPGEKAASFTEGMLGLTRRVIAENLVPIWLQGTVLDGGDLAGRIMRGGAEFFGGRAYPEKVWDAEFPQLGLSVNDGYSVLSREQSVYTSNNYYSDIARKLGATEPEKVLKDKEYPPSVKSIAEARQINQQVDDLLNENLSSLNADPSKGDTFRELYAQWRERVSLGDDKAALKEFDARYPKAKKGNLTQRQYVLLQQYNQLSPDDTKGREQFKRDNPEIAINPREEYLKSHPDENAKLAVWGQAGIFSAAAYEKTMGLAKELDIPDNALPEFKFDGTVIPDDPELRKAFFEYQETVAKFKSGSPEALLLLAKNDKLRELLGRKTPITTPVPALEIAVKNRKLTDEYNALTSEQQKRTFEQAHPEWMDDRARIAAYEKQYAYDNTIADKKAIDTQIAFDKLQTNEQRLAFFKSEPDFARKHFAKEATGKLGAMWANLVADDYAEYRMRQMAGELKGLEDDWFWLEHPNLYLAMTATGKMAVKDLSKVPSRTVAELYQQYVNLPDNEMMRRTMREGYPNLDRYLMEVKGFAPLSVAVPKTTAKVAAPVKKPVTAAPQPKQKVILPARAKAATQKSTAGALRRMVR